MAKQIIEKIEEDFLEANWLFLSYFFVSSIAVQLSDNISDIWLSIVLFRGEIASIQVFDDDISSSAITKTVKIMLLPKPVDKIVMTSLLWRRL